MSIIDSFLQYFSEDMIDTKLISFIDGIANTDITKDNINKMIDMTCELAEGKDVPEVTWISYAPQQGGK